MSGEKNSNKTTEPAPIFEPIKWALGAWLDQLSYAKLEELVTTKGIDLNRLMIEGAKERLSQMGYYCGHC